MTTRVKPSAASATLAHSNGDSILNDAKLKRIYAAMLQCGVLAERLPGANGAAGHAAVEAACAELLRPEDTIVPTRRGFIADFLQGVPLETIFTELRAGWRSSGCGPGRASGASRKPAALADAMRLGVSLASANRERKTANVVVVIPGCGMTPPDPWREAVGLAAGRRLPMILVDGKHPGGGTAARARRRKNLPAIAARNGGAPVIPVAGDDVVAIHRVIEEAIRHARQGDGPTVIECVSWPPGGAPPANRAANPDKEKPIPHLEQYLKQRQIVHTAWKTRVLREFTRKLDAAIERAGGLPHPARPEHPIENEPLSRLRHP